MDSPVDVVFIAHRERQKSMSSHDSGGICPVLQRRLGVIGISKFHSARIWFIDMERNVIVFMADQTRMYITMALSSDCVSLCMYVGGPVHVSVCEQCVCC